MCQPNLWKAKGLIKDQHGFLVSQPEDIIYAKITGCIEMQNCGSEMMVINVFNMLIFVISIFLVIMFTVAHQ